MILEQWTVVRCPTLSMDAFPLYRSGLLGGRGTWLPALCRGSLSRLSEAVVGQQFAGGEHFDPASRLSGQALVVGH